MPRLLLLLCLVVVTGALAPDGLSALVDDGCCAEAGAGGACDGACDACLHCAHAPVAPPVAATAGAVLDAHRPDELQPQPQPVTGPARRIFHPPRRTARARP